MPWNAAIRYVLRVLLLVGGVVGHAMLPASARAAASLSDLVALSSRSSDNRHPAIASSSDGSRVVAVFDGVVSKERRILLRESIDGVWLPEVIVDGLPLGENEIPSVAIDEAGNPHVAWVALSGGRFVPQYAARIAGVWISIQVPPAETGGDCDYISAQVDDQGSPWLVWQSARGSAYGVYCGYLNDSGGFHVESLTPGSQAHNLFPEVVFDPEPTVLWYAGRDDGFYLVGERFDRAAGQWGDVRLNDLTSLPGEPLPQLVRRSSGLLAAFWYDQPGKSETADVLLDRVFLGEQGLLQGVGEPLDQPLDASNSRVSGAAAGNNMAATWCSTSPDEGTQIYAAYGKSAAESTAVKLSDDSDFYYAGPRLTADAHNVSVVWESTEAEGGDGQIYYRQISGTW